MSCPITGDPTCKCTQKETLRKLFTEHAVYTKFYIESALQSLPDLGVITARLIKKQSDIGNYVKPVIGKKNGDTLTTLLKAHILAAADAVNAIKGKDKNVIDAAIKKVFSNSAQVAGFLSSLNPSKLPYETVSTMFNTHNQYVIDMATAHSQNEYDKEIELFDKYYTHMLMFSDTLNNALVKPNDYALNLNLDLTIWSIIVVLIILVIVYFYYRSNDTTKQITSN